MKQNFLRSKACMANLQSIKLTNITRRFVVLTFFVCALLATGTLMAQTITVDGNPGDWPAVLSSSTIPFKSYIRDPLNSHSDDVWTRGSQNTDPVSRWYWKYGNTNDKTDLGNTGIALIGHKIYFFADLYANNGDASVGFWLLKGGVAPVAGGSFTGAHVEGDILVSALFTHGHATATPAVYKWHSGALTRVTLSPAAEGAATNSSSVSAPWPYTPKSGSAGTYPANSFFEGFVNLDSVNATFDGCFSSYLIVTWESQAPPAALADLVAGQFTSSPAVTVASDTVCFGSSAVFSATVTGGGSPITYSWNGGAFTSTSTYTINPATTSGMVTVVVMGSNSCSSASDTAQLFVRPVPNVNSLCDYSYCNGSAATAITFSGSVSGTTFAWTSTADVGFGTSGTGNIAAFTAHGGTSTVTAIVTVTPSANGCTGTPVSFVITVHPSPVVTVRDTSVCMGSTVCLTGSPAGGTWAGYGISSGSTFDATSLSAGVYTVSYYMISSYGCVGAANATVTVVNCACGGRPATTTVYNNDYSIYPNPSDGSFVLNIPPLKAQAELLVTDVSGKVVEKRIVAKNDNSQQLSFNLSGVSKGVYNIQLQNKDVHYSNKVLLR
jgi:hypothetical protein